MTEPNFHDFNQSHRYSVTVETRLVLSLPVTEFRPEAMRVTERKTTGSVWYEVESFNERLNRWIDQKSHPTEAKAIADANGWYPQPECPAVDLRTMPVLEEKFQNIQHPYAKFTVGDAIALATNNAKMFNRNTPGTLREVRDYIHALQAQEIDQAHFVALDVLDAAIDGRDLSKDCRLLNFDQELMNMAAKDVTVSVLRKADSTRGHYLGRIVEVGATVLVQDVGRNECVIHDVSKLAQDDFTWKKLETLPQLGEMVQIKYKHGLGTVEVEKKAPQVTRGI